MAEPTNTHDKEGEVLLNAKTSERQFWRDSTGLQRHIWRPGDGDGDLAEAYGETHGLVGAVEKRWKFYQLTEGPIKFRINEPPKNVVLDDRACWELLSSNMPKAQMSKHWPQDFSGQGKLRSRRPHRGRSALKDPNAPSEKERFQSYDYGGKGGIYYFTGERAYEPTFYGPLELEPDLKAEPEEAAQSLQNAKPKGHNQYTPIDELVRNGAQSASTTRGKYRDRVNTFLRRSPSPPLSRNNAFLFSGLPATRNPAHTGFRDTAMMAGLNFDPTHGMPREPLAPISDSPLPGVVHEPVESFFLEQDEEDEPMGPSVLDQQMTFAEDRKRQQEQQRGQPQRKRARRMGYIERIALGLLEEEIEAEYEQRVTDDGAAASSGDVHSCVQELEQELERAIATIAEQDRELGELKAQLETLHKELAMQRSMMEA